MTEQKIQKHILDALHSHGIWAIKVISANRAGVPDIIACLPPDGKGIMIEREIDGRVIRIEDSERQPCEVWSRVMGYYRPVSEFNIGKKQEHRERVFYTEKTAERIVEP